MKKSGEKGSGMKSSAKLLFIMLSVGVLHQFGCLNLRCGRAMSAPDEIGTIYFGKKKAPIDPLAGNNNTVSSLDYLDLESGIRGECAIGVNMRTDGWSIEGDYISCCVDGVWSLRSLSSRKEICTFPGDYIFSSVSPALNQVVLLENGPTVWALDESDTKRAYQLGKRCRLRIFSVPSGKLVRECDKPVLNFGVCWAGENWSNVVFVSFTNAANFSLTGNDMPQGCDNYYYPGPPDRFPTHLHMLNPDSGHIVSLCEGLAPQRTYDGKKITFYLKGRTHIVSLGDKCSDPRILHTIPRSCSYTMSPSGKFVLTSVSPKYEWNRTYSLVVVNLETERIEYIVSEDLDASCSYAWSSNSLVDAMSVLRDASAVTGPVSDTER